MVVIHAPPNPWMNCGFSHSSEIGQGARGAYKDKKGKWRNGAIGGKGYRLQAIWGRRKSKIKRQKAKIRK